jgi:hypothetical protein
MDSLFILLVVVGLPVWLCIRPGYKIEQNVEAGRDGNIHCTYSVWEKKLYGNLIAYRLSKEAAEKILRELEG